MQKTRNFLTTTLMRGQNPLLSLRVALLMTDRANNSLSKRCSHQGGDTYGYSCDYPCVIATANNSQ